MLLRSVKKGRSKEQRRNQWTYGLYLELGNDPDVKLGRSMELAETRCVLMGQPDVELGLGSRMQM